MVSVGFHEDVVRYLHQFLAKCLGLRLVQAVTGNDDAEGCHGSAPDHDGRGNRSDVVFNAASHNGVTAAILSAGEDFASGGPFQGDAPSDPTGVPDRAR